MLIEPTKLTEWEVSPFGRSLTVLPLRLPPGSRADYSWGLERGFHLEVIDEEIFALTLGPIGGTFEIEVPLHGHSDPSGVERLLLWHSPKRYRQAELQRFADLLRYRKNREIGVILSPTDERWRGLFGMIFNRSPWRGLERPVIHVFQDFPDHSFFSLEKNLAELGRIGRHLTKFARWRRLLPW